MEGGRQDRFLGKQIFKIKDPHIFELVKSPPGADSEVLAACLLAVFGVLWLARAPSSNYMGTSA